MGSFRFGWSKKAALSGEAFKLRPKLWEDTGYRKIWERTFLAEGTSKHKGPGAGKCLAWLKDSIKAYVAEVEQAKGRKTEEANRGPDNSQISGDFQVREKSSPWIFSATQSYGKVRDFKYDCIWASSVTLTAFSLCGFLSWDSCFQVHLIVFEIAFNYSLSF